MLVAMRMGGMGRAFLTSAVTLATALAGPVAAAAEPAATDDLRAPASIESAPSEPARPPTWDEALGEPAAPPPATPAPVPVAAPIPAEPAARPQPPTAAVLAEMRRGGNGMIIGAAAAATIGTLLNGLRVYIVTGPCQTAAQEGCSMGFFMSTPLAMGSNIASMALAGVGGGERGAHDGWVVPDRHRRRSPAMLAAGIPLVFLGITTSIALRALWLSDYSSPEGPEIFDFARPSHAYAYFGGQQISATALAAGLGMIAYQGRGARIRRNNLVAAPWVGGSTAGVRLGGRF